MSRILRRPLFRGGPVSSYGTGIASGLADNRRVGLDNGGFLPAWAKGADARGYKIGSELYPDTVDQGTFDINDLKNTIVTNRNILDKKQFIPIGSEDNQDFIAKTTEDIYLENVEKQKAKEKEAEERGITVQEMEAIDRENLSSQGIGDVEKEKMMAGVLNMNDENNPPPPPPAETAERYEINADDVREQAALFDKLLNEDYEKDKRSAQISDASDYALQFFKSTIGEGKGIKEAAGDVAGRALATPSRTEKVQEGKKKTKQTATVMAINEAIAQGKSARDIDMLIAKSGLDLDNKKALVDYGQTLTKGFNALAGHVAESKAIGFAGRLKDGLRKSGLIGYPTETVTSVEMKDKFEFDPAEDVGKIFIETDTETAYIFDKNGKKTPVA